MKYKLPFLFLSLAFFVGASQVSAMSCEKPDDNVRNRSDIIFLGKVTAITASSSVAAEHATFAISKWWKGDIPSVLDVGGIYSRQVLYGAPANSFFTVGRSYLVFANQTPTSPLARGIPLGYVAAIDCSGTSDAEAQQAKDMIATLGTGFTATSTTPISPTTPTTPVIVDPEPPINPSGYLFTRNLTIGSTGADVVALQTALVDRGYLVMPTGVSKGYFGPLTRDAVAKYQGSKGISPTLGYFGPLTRASMNPR